MNRRKFLSATAGIGGLFAAEPSLVFSQTKSGKANSRPVSELAGVTLGDLREKYRRDLFDDFLPFMDKYVIDHEYGGFMCLTDYTGERESDKKLSWFEGRGSWVYAFLYNNLAREQKYLDVARKSIDFVLKSKPKNENELWSKELSRDGKPLSPPDGEIYGDLFIAEGLAELSKATGDKKFWDEAKNLVLKCVKIYDRADYRPIIGQTYLGKDARPFPGARIQGAWMVLVRVATQMLRMRPDAQLESIAARSVDAVLNHHFNPEFGLNNELLNHDLSRPRNEYAQLVYTGHGIETLWMMLFEAERLKNKQLFNTFAERFRRHTEVAWDDVYGGVFRNLMNVNENRWTLDKVLWAQEEVLIGSLYIFEKTGADWASEMFNRTYEYVIKTYPLKKYGSPLWMYAGNRKVEFEEFKTRPKRVENYHHPRHLMLNILSLDRMINRSGRTS
ncbi:MAG: AGE family epimerase/isomerase [Acidobacteria bacterium]|jgi:mannose/cellobiose epimerase-like protein (N-acyl-D-glucosamine 2-epimerase family)|nr:AGE family epimerase/isomerase [Acidobacteriota bacterium]